ncbi:MAG: hypothetical protein HYR60_17860 [Acidobacteria bacterium]|nr:hypothetical protein [Acidobacteriota bacterium]
MKRLVSLTMFAAYVLLVLPRAQAQDCSDWSNFDIRGTYAMSGSGWIDLSKLVPALPAGTIPMAWVGAVSYNGRGGGAGWVALNAGGVQMAIELVNLAYQVKADCSVAVSYSMKLKELGITLGPVSRILVVAGRGQALELNGIQAGAGPGTPVDLMVARRISIQSRD